MTETNGIAGIKKIKFDFEFIYQKDGDEELGDTIVIREPTLSDLDVHSYMTAEVTKGLFGAMPVMKSMMPENEIEDASQSDDKGDGAEQERSAMFIMALGMDTEKYTKFQKYVKYLLTNDTRFAHVENEDIAVTDLVWKSIEEHGGMAAIDKILAGFTSFFIEAMDEKKAA